PSSPTVSGSSETPLGTIGVSTNGVAIFSNDAGPGDTLSKEAGTFDTYAGHPQQQGVYHYHAEPIYLTSTNTANLIGVSLDGYAIYGTKCDNGTSDTSDDYSPASPSSSPTGTGLDSNHGHTTTTTHFSTATYHYHVGLDSTAGITTIFGDYFHGAPGSAR
ncbi:MAG: YHYH protein, partial [Leptospiraceae bacterium]|nr:YHYH protein [Leptospiraceae bacterium]